MQPLTSLTIGGESFSPWLVAPVVLALWILVFLVVKRIVLAAMRRVARKTAWAWDDIVIEAISSPLLILILASGFVVFGRILPLEPEVDRAFDILFAFAVALALILFADRATHGVLDRLSAGSQVMMGVQGLLQAGARGLFIGIGLLIFLDSIGISITPILASLGVGSLAVALALQDTLANLFAGIHMIADKPIEPGQMIRLPGGEEGHVLKIGWRSTWIRMPPNNVLIIPNGKLAGGIIINYDLPQREITLNVQVGVHYDSDLERVERVTLEVGHEVQRSVAGAVQDAAPVVRFQSFADSSIQFVVTLRARDFAGTAEVRHEFVKRLQARFRKEGIVIPYPIRTLDVPPAHAEGLRGLLRDDS
ncbi:MAG TPA: mechanosensitive ion channel family protein [Candidatus Polarisedimenticolia bacterium]|nr:mechanosensitive ion channel family protein [Candidatus Polarisedimenticolia bacterium]